MMASLGSIARIVSGYPSASTLPCSIAGTLYGRAVGHCATSKQALPCMQRRLLSNSGSQGEQQHAYLYPFLAGTLCGSLVTAALASIVLDKQRKTTKDASPDDIAARLHPYFELLDQHPSVLGPIGDAAAGEIEIIRDPAVITKVEKDTGQKMGIVAENKWQIWIADAVKFPNGVFGVYGRFLWKQSLKGPSGAAILPILPNGDVLVISIYRHPLRKWVLEIPRGNGEGAEILNALIKRELKEETGAEISSIEHLGKINADSGITLGGIPLVKVQISKMGNHKRDDAETSIHLHSFSMAQLEQAILNGFAMVKINGKMKQVEIGTDSFMLGALYLNKLKTEQKKKS